MKNVFIIKNNIIKITACITMFCLIFSSLFITGFAEEGVEDDNYRHLENCATNYYTKLTANFGENKNGTCSYVAGAMLLSYYDSYLSDLFIDENYEVSGEITDTSTVPTITESPGILKDDHWDSSGCSTYGDFINSYADTYFHLKLVQLGRDIMGFHSSSGSVSHTDADGHPRVSDGTSNISWSISIPELASLLTAYLNGSDDIDSRGFWNGAVTVNYTSYLDMPSNLSQEEKDACVRGLAIDKIEDGIPVVYAGFYEDENTSEWKGHALIAYDYDGTYLKFHSGWDSNESRIIKENDNIFKYKEKLYVLWLDIDYSKIQHSCSHNYSYFSDYNLDVCMCNLSVHPSHTHSGSYVSYNLISHTRDCNWCGAVETEDHSYYYTLYSTTQHRARCDCGYSMLEPHVVSASINNRKTCLRCGALVGSGGIQYNSVNDVTYISDSGSYIRPDGVIVLSEADTALYLSGQLSWSEILENCSCTQ